MHIRRTRDAHTDRGESQNRKRNAVINFGCWLLSSFRVCGCVHESLLLYEVIWWLTTHLKRPKHLQNHSVDDCQHLSFQLEKDSPDSPWSVAEQEIFKRENTTIVAGTPNPTDNNLSLKGKFLHCYFVGFLCVSSRCGCVNLHAKRLQWLNEIENWCTNADNWIASSFFGSNEQWNAMKTRR